MYFSVPPQPAPLIRCERVSGRKRAAAASPASQPEQKLQRHDDLITFHIPVTPISICTEPRNVHYKRGRGQIGDDLVEPVVQREHKRARIETPRQVESVASSNFTKCMTGQATGNACTTLALYVEPQTHRVLGTVGEELDWMRMRIRRMGSAFHQECNQLANNFLTERMTALAPQTLSWPIIIQTHQEHTELKEKAVSENDDKASCLTASCGEDFEM